MPETNERVMEMVREQLDEDPEVANRELYEQAVEVDPSVEDLSLRQFHARYPLQVKRKRSSTGDGRGAAEEGESTAPDEGAERRQVVRQGLLRFARDVASADDRAEVIDVLTSVDGYVDDVVGELGGA